MFNKIEFQKNPQVSAAQPIPKKCLQFVGVALNQQWVIILIETNLRLFIFSSFQFLIYKVRHKRSVRHNSLCVMLLNKSDKKVAL